MKWFRNKEYMQESLKKCKKTNRKSNLMKDHINLLQDHLLVLDGLEEACKILSWDCPCSQDLIDDLDCENRCTPDIDYSECWAKYLLKEVLDNAT